jgi:hypothetical protein
MRGIVGEVAVDRNYLLREYGERLLTRVTPPSGRTVGVVVDGELDASGHGLGPWA